jgi:hypothetical protein
LSFRIRRVRVIIFIALFFCEPHLTVIVLAFWVSFCTLQFYIVLFSNNTPNLFWQNLKAFSQYICHLLLFVFLSLLPNQYRHRKSSKLGLLNVLMICLRKQQFFGPHPIRSQEFFDDMKKVKFFRSSILVRGSTITNYQFWFVDKFHWLIEVVCIWGCPKLVFWIQNIDLWWFCSKAKDPWTMIPNQTPRTWNSTSFWFKLKRIQKYLQKQ